MFNKRCTLIAIITFLIVLVTAFISFNELITTVSGTQIWYTLASVWLSEILLGLVFAEILKSNTRTIPFLLGHLIVSISYVIFSFIGVFIFTNNITDSALISILSIALLIVLILHISFGIASSSLKKSDGQHAVSLINKKLFSEQLITFKSIHAKWLSENAEFNKKINALIEDVKFSSDSISAAEKIDNRIIDLLEQMNNADSAENAVILADLIKTTLAERNTIIKNSR